MREALWQASEPPTELADYWLGAAFWHRLGVSIKDLDDWPEMKVRRWSTVIEMVAKHEEWAQEMASRKAQAEARG